MHQKNLYRNYISTFFIQQYFSTPKKPSTIRERRLLMKINRLCENIQSSLNKIGHCYYF